MKEISEDISYSKFQLDIIEIYNNNYEVVFTAESYNEKIIRGYAKYSLDVVLSNCFPLSSNICQISLTKYDWDETYDNWKVDMFYNGTTNLIRTNEGWKISQ